MEEQRPVGRPTVYRPEFCEKVIEWGALGKSKSWMAAQMDVSHQTVLRWEAAHEEFREAMTRAVVKAQAHWEDLGQDHLLTAGFQSSVWSRSMAARFPDHWREKTAHVGGGPEDPAIKQEVKHTGVDEVLSRISGLAARIGASNSAPGAE